jgi:hypothetical protein
MLAIFTRPTCPTCPSPCSTGGTIGRVTSEGARKVPVKKALWHGRLGGLGGLGGC